MSVQRTDLEQMLNSRLRVEHYKDSDYGPNGLQIEGKDTIKKIAFAVSATRYTIQKAVAEKVDALIVHHGLFWTFHGPRPIKGAFAKRVIPLIREEINLFGFHLPLDGHIELGNAAGIAHQLGLTEITGFGGKENAPLGVRGEFETPILATELREKLVKILSHDVVHSCPEHPQKIKKMSIITGGAKNDWKLAKAQGHEAYLTGEMSEHHWHEAKEAGVHMFAGGHHATEVFGVMALKQVIENEFSVETVSILEDNPA